MQASIAYQLFSSFSPGNKTKQNTGRLKRKSSRLDLEIAATSINIDTLVLNQQYDERGDGIDVVSVMLTHNRSITHISYKYLGK